MTTQTIEAYLDEIEAQHRKNTGRFCYVATMADSHRIYQLSIVEYGVPGHWPISADIFLGTQQEAQRKATLVLERSKILTGIQVEPTLYSLGDVNEMHILSTIGSIGLLIGQVPFIVKFFGS